MRTPIKIPAYFSDDQVLGLPTIAALLNTSTTRVRRIPGLPIRQFPKRFGLTAGALRRYLAERDRFERKPRKRNDAASAADASA